MGGRFGGESEQSIDGTVTNNHKLQTVTNRAILVKAVVVIIIIIIMQRLTRHVLVIRLTNRRRGDT